jgi:hypothetical protein
MGESFPGHADRIIPTEKAPLTQSRVGGVLSRSGHGGEEINRTNVGCTAYRSSRMRSCSITKTVDKWPKEFRDM